MFTSLGEGGQSYWNQEIEFCQEPEQYAWVSLSLPLCSSLITLSLLHSCCPFSLLFFVCGPSLTASAPYTPSLPQIALTYSVSIPNTKNQISNWSSEPMGWFPPGPEKVGLKKTEAWARLITTKGVYHKLRTHKNNVIYHWGPSLV